MFIIDLNRNTAFDILFFIIVTEITIKMLLLDQQLLLY